jgi:hypothetical protein
MALHQEVSQTVRVRAFAKPVMPEIIAKKLSVKLMRKVLAVNLKCVDMVGV